MTDFHYILADVLLGTEFLAAFIGILYFSRLRHSYWKWFVIYLVVIFLQELFWIKISWFSRGTSTTYYAYVGVPIQYLFFYWLYAIKSMKSTGLFVICSLILIASIIYLNTLFKITDVLFLSTSVGTALLVMLLILEFLKQIRKDDILRFKENKMFYINIGMILFYLGSYPFQIFVEEFYNNHLGIWRVYYAYFLISNCIMYLSFAASFIWGKTR